MTRTPTTVAELRAEIAKGCQQAASVYRAEAKKGLRNADAVAARLDADAERNKRLANDPR